MMNRGMWSFAAAALIVAIGWGAMASAQEYVPAAAESKLDTSTDGWDATATVGASVNFHHNRSVVGQLDGQAWTLGGTAIGELFYQKAGMHDWRNSLSLLETFTYGPPVNRFVKSGDQLAFESVYYFRIPSVPYIGPFARFRLDTAVFEGTDTRAAPTTWLIAKRDGTTATFVGNRLKLTDSFSPLTLKESIGFFARPIEKDYLEWEFRAGFGSQQVFAEGQRALADDAATPEIEVNELRSFVQAGAELGTTLQGKLENNRVAYKVWVDVMTPFFRQKEAGDDRGAFKMTNVEVGAKVSFKMVEWASLDYEFKALRVPQLADVFQVQNNLLLTFAYTLLKKDEPPPAPPAPPCPVCPTVVPVAAPAVVPTDAPVPAVPAEVPAPPAEVPAPPAVN